MRKLINLAKWGATLGSAPQTFLGAKWVGRVLDRSEGESAAAVNFAKQVVPRHLVKRFDGYDQERRRRQ